MGKLTGKEELLRFSAYVATSSLALQNMPTIYVMEQVLVQGGKSWT